MLLRVSRAALMAASVMLLSLLAAAPSASATTTSFAWNAPGSATGPGAFRVDVDFGEDNECTITLEGTAGATDGPAVRLAFGPSWGMISSGHLVQVHSEDLGVDTRGEPSGASGLRFTLTDWVISGDLSFTILNANMDGWLAGQPEPWYPARFDISCDAEITVLGFSGSREVGAFSDDTMSGGDGASVNGLFARAAVTLGDSFSRSFTTPRVEVDVTEFGASVADWTLEAPSGTIGSGGLGMGAEFTHNDGAGNYTFTMDRVGEGYLWAWFAGFADVAALDDILA